VDNNNKDKDSINTSYTSITTATIFIIAAIKGRFLVRAISGISGRLQDGFPGQPKLNYNHGLEDESKAIYVSKGLVKGNNAFLDVMQSEWRQYIDERDQSLINSNVFPSGCAEHANEYLIYLVDSRQVVAVLNNEPRLLSITPDTGQIDLTAEETTLAVKSFFAQLIEQHGKTNKNAVAPPFVTAV
jgi:hypothetical protein